jgi:glycosyltransferase involved in cell wall biosynthesis
VTGAGPRIGVVMPLAEQRGGAEMALLHFLKGLMRESQADIRLCFLEAGPMVEWARQHGYAATVVETGRLRQLVRYSSAVRLLYRWLKRDDISVVLSWMSKAHLYAGPAAWLARIPALWWQHGIPARRGLDMLVSLVPARRILACSKAAVEAQRRLSGTRADVVAVYPGVDLDRLSAAERTRVGRQALGLPREAVVIGIVARLEPWKGVDVVLKGLRELLRRGKRPHLVVIGGPHPLNPQYAVELTRLADKLDLREHVTFCGHQSNVAHWMCEMDIVVSASFGEPFGMVIVEAMGLGKAVIATRSGGPREIVVDEVNGLLVEPGDVAGLVEALSRLADSPELRTRLGESARQRAIQFSAPRFVADVWAAIHKVPQ